MISCICKTYGGYFKMAEAQNIAVQSDGIDRPHIELEHIVALDAGVIGLNVRGQSDKHRYESEVGAALESRAQRTTRKRFGLIGPEETYLVLGRRFFMEVNYRSVARSVHEEVVKSLVPSELEQAKDYNKGVPSIQRGLDSTIGEI